MWVPHVEGPGHCVRRDPTLLIDAVRNPGERSLDILRGNLMQELDPDRPLRHAMRVDVSLSCEHVEEQVAAAVAAGGRIVDDAAAPEGWLLADRAGNGVSIAAWPDAILSQVPEDQQ